MCDRIQREEGGDDVRPRKQTPHIACTLLFHNHTQPLTPACACTNKRQGPALPPASHSSHTPSAGIGASAVTAQRLPACEFQAAPLLARGGMSQLDRVTHRTAIGWAVATTKQHHCQQRQREWGIAKR